MTAVYKMSILMSRIVYGLPETHNIKRRDGEAIDLAKRLRDEGNKVALFIEGAKEEDREKLSETCGFPLTCIEQSTLHEGLKPYMMLHPLLTYRALTYALANPSRD